MTPAAKVCCCAHVRWEHRDNGEGECRVCGAGCPHFHGIGEGHGYAFELVLLILAVILALGSWRYWRIRRLADKRIASAQDAFKFYDEERP